MLLGGPEPGAWGLGPENPPPSMCHRVQQHVDGDTVTVHRELPEVFRILALALPRVADVGVVGHEDHGTAPRIRDGASVHGVAVSAALRSAAGEEGTDTGNLRHALLQIEHHVEDRVVEWDVHERILVCREHYSNLAFPYV